MTLQARAFSTDLLHNDSRRCLTMTPQFKVCSTDPIRSENLCPTELQILMIRVWHHGTAVTETGLWILDINQVGVHLSPSSILVATMILTVPTSRDMSPSTTLGGRVYLILITSQHAGAGHLRRLCDLAQVLVLALVLVLTLALPLASNSTNPELIRLPS